MSTNLSFGRDAQGYNAYAPQFATDNYSATITNGVASSITVPSNHAAWVAVFSYDPGMSVWVARNAVAAIPISGSLTSTNSTLNPGVRLVYAGDTISCITGDTSAEVGISLYAISYP